MEDVKSVLEMMDRGDYSALKEIAIWLKEWAAILQDHTVKSETFSFRITSTLRANNAHMLAEQIRSYVNSEEMF